MLVNSSLTVYHKTLDKNTRLEKWIRYSYDNIWWFGGKGSGINKGYDNANDVEIRVPYGINHDLDINNFKMGDILVQGIVRKDIQTQQDLVEYDVYNITSLTNNTFGNNKHIHIGGR